MIIKIGADELILWLRKNGRAVNVRNDDLGVRISDLIQKNLGGTLDDKDRNTRVYWEFKNDARHIADIDLPKTAAQYSIDTNVLPRLYETLNSW